MRKYILQDGFPLECDDILTWAEWFEKADRKVAVDKIGDVMVSTIFLGLDHNWWEIGPPVLWETMVFGGPLDGEMDRYTSSEDAKKGHEVIVAKVKAAFAAVCN